MDALHSVTGAYEKGMERQSIWDRYCTDRSPQAAARLVETYHPLVASVCRRYLRRSQDVEDAVQETFVKLLHHSSSVRGELRGWLTTAAYSTCIDLIRRSNSQRRRCEDARHLEPPAAEHWFVHEAIRAKLHEALLQLDDASRVLLIDRFVRKTPLRVIAGREAASVATVSRQTTRAVSDLAAVLRDMGVESADDLTLAEHFGDPSNLPPDEPAADDGLRFALDWRVTASLLEGAEVRPISQPCLPGWSRAIRVGAFLSYASNVFFNRLLSGNHLSLEAQVHSLDFLNSPGFELVGIIEPGTGGVGPVERTLRQYDLTAGLIDATDTAGLQTLDVILLGINFVITRPIVHAVNQAVRGGVGLLKEWWLGGHDVTCQPSTWSDPEAAELLLADSPVHNFHAARCGVLVPGTVQEEHVLMPGLAKRSQVLTEACGPVYRAAPGAKVLVTKNYIVRPEQHGIAGLGPVAPPAYVVGQLGGGRVVFVQAFSHGLLWTQALTGTAYLENLLSWLAEPRRQTC